MDIITLNLIFAPNPNDKPKTYSFPGKGYDPSLNNKVVPYTGEVKSLKINVNLFFNANESKYKDSDLDKEGRRYRNIIISDALSGILSGRRYK